MSTSPCGAVGVLGLVRTVALDSGGGHGYINGGSAAGGHVSFGAWALALGALAIAAGGDSKSGLAGAGAAYCVATTGPPAARQRTKKLPSLLLSTGFIS